MDIYEGVSAKKLYFIPHNYKETGRVFGLFQMKHLMAAFIWAVPITLLILVLSDVLSFQVQLYVWSFLAGVPAGALLLGWGDIVQLVVRFHRHKRVYYSQEYKE